MDFEPPGAPIVDEKLTLQRRDLFSRRTPKPRSGDPQQEPLCELQHTWPVDRILPVFVVQNMVVVRIKEMASPHFCSSKWLPCMFVPICILCAKYGGGSKPVPPCEHPNGMSVDLACGSLLVTFWLLVGFHVASLLFGSIWSS